jgi:hypothetical protein
MAASHLLSRLTSAALRTAAAPPRRTPAYAGPTQLLLLRARRMSSEEGHPQQHAPGHAAGRRTEHVTSPPATPTSALQRCMPVVSMPRANGGTLRTCNCSSGRHAKRPQTRLALKEAPIQTVRLVHRASFHACARHRLILLLLLLSLEGTVHGLSTRRTSSSTPRSSGSSLQT